MYREHTRILLNAMTHSIYLLSALATGAVIGKIIVVFL